MNLRPPALLQSGNRSAGYEPAGITWLPHLADSILTQGEYISVCTTRKKQDVYSNEHHVLFSVLLKDTCFCSTHLRFDNIKEGEDLRNIILHNNT